MKKLILKNVAILTFALFGLGIIGNNLSYAKDSVYHDPGDGGGGSGIQLYRHSCSHYNNYWECRSTVNTYECDKATSCD